jgi:hypothetical protein
VKATPASSLWGEKQMARQEAQHSIRPARKSECLRIAELYRISSDGVADYIWTKLAQPGEDILDLGRRRYEREGQRILTLMSPGKLTVPS